MVSSRPSPSILTAIRAMLRSTLLSTSRSIASAVSLRQCRSTDEGGQAMKRRYQAFDARDRRPVDDDVAFDARGVIRDGFGLRVPMEFMDSIQRQVADAKRRKTVQYDPQGCVKSTFEEEVEED